MRSRFREHALTTLCSLAFLVTAGGCAPYPPMSSTPDAPISAQPSARTIARLPSWFANAAASGTANIGVQGWGPGAAGISLGYLDHPYADTLAAELLRGIQRDRVIPIADYIGAGDLSQGGASHLLITFHDGVSIGIDRAAWIPRKGDSKSPPYPAGTVYYVNVTSVSASGEEKDSMKQAVAVADTSGGIRAVWPKVYQAINSMNPEALYPPVRPSAAWLRQLTADRVTQYTVEGNDGTHLIRRVQSTQALQSDANKLVGTLKTSVVVDSAKVGSTKFGFRSWGRTHARSLAITLHSGDSVYLDAGYGIMKPNQPPRSDPNLFRVTYTSRTGTMTVFVEDRSGVLQQVWSGVVGSCSNDGAIKSVNEWLVSDRVLLSGMTSPSRSRPDAGAFSACTSAPP